MSLAVSFASASACWTGCPGALDQVGGDLVERRAHQRGVEVLGPGGVRGDERQADGGLRHRRQLDLGLLCRLEQPLQGLRVLAQVDPVFPLEVIGQVVDDAAVEVVPAQVGVTGGGPHLDHALADVEDADVEGPAAQVEDQHRLVALLVQAVGQRGRGRFVDDAQHLEPGDAARVPGRLPLCVIEVRGDGDDGLGDLLAEELRRVLGELAQHEGRDLLRRVLLAADLESGLSVRPGHHVERHGVQLALDLIETPADEALGRVDRALRVQDRLTAGQLADQALPLGGKGHHRRGRPRPLRIRDHRRLAPLAHRDHRIGGTQVDSDCFRHRCLISGHGTAAGAQCCHQ